jgi:hypothetical protein
MAAADIFAAFAVFAVFVHQRACEKKDFFWWYATKKYIFLDLDSLKHSPQTPRTPQTPRHLPPTGSGIIGDKTWDFIF